MGKIPKLPHALGIFPVNHFHVEMNQTQIGYIKLQIEYSKKEKKTEMEKENNCKDKMKKDAFALCRRFLNWNNFCQFKGESLLIK